jgi:predicted Rossmann-fold nucleotide-binding protein
MIMNKFQKRLSKLLKNCENAVVVGHGFGYLREITEMFKTVFVISSSPPGIKLKNLVYMEEFNNLSQISEVSIIFVDLEKIHSLENFEQLWRRTNSLVAIEGNDAIGRDLSTTLYRSGYECTGLHGFYHIWESKK